MQLRVAFWMRALLLRVFMGGTDGSMAGLYSCEDQISAILRAPKHISAPALCPANLPGQPDARLRGFGTAGSGPTSEWLSACGGRPGPSIRSRLALPAGGAALAALPVRFISPQRTLSASLEFSIPPTCRKSLFARSLVQSQSMWTVHLKPAQPKSEWIDPISHYSLPPCENGPLQPPGFFCPQ